MGIAPWKEVAVNLIGPWKVLEVADKLRSTLTCIDTVSKLVEPVWIEHKAVEHIHDKFMQS